MKNKLLQKALDQVPEHSRVFARRYTDIIDRIHFLLESKGFKQKDLALSLGKRESEVSKWLNGGHNLTLKTIAKMEAALGDEIISVPESKGEGKFVGWKKTSISHLHVHVPKVHPLNSEEFELVDVEGTKEVPEAS